MQNPFTGDHLGRGDELLHTSALWQSINCWNYFQAVALQLGLKKIIPKQLEGQKNKDDAYELTHISDMMRYFRLPV